MKLLICCGLLLGCLVAVAFSASCGGCQSGSGVQLCSSDHQENPKRSSHETATK
jgi:hypothetical protein